MRKRELKNQGFEGAEVIGDAIVITIALKRCGSKGRDVPSHFFSAASAGEIVIGAEDTAVIAFTRHTD